jgi:hypothetical protein
MFGFDSKIVDRFSAVAKAAGDAAYRNFSHAAASIRKIAQGEIKRAPGVSSTAGIRRDAAGRFQKGSGRKRVKHQASPPGTPPYTSTGQLPRAIVFDATKDGAVIGPRASIVGESAHAQEFGGEYRGGHFPEDAEARAFMYPALVAAAPRFADDWQGSIGE